MRERIASAYKKGVFFNRSTWHTLCVWQERNRIGTKRTSIIIMYIYIYINTNTNTRISHLHRRVRGCMENYEQTANTKLLCVRIDKWLSCASQNIFTGAFRISMAFIPWKIFNCSIRGLFVFYINTITPIEGLLKLCQTTLSFFKLKWPWKNLLPDRKKKKNVF